jgi:primosomal protein N'
MVYLFSFKKFAGSDRVFIAKNVVGNPGDLLETVDDVLLHLGDEVAFPEMYTYQYAESPMHVMYPGFFDQRFLTLLHWMAYERYSPYKKIMKHFVSMDIHELLHRELKVKSQKQKKPAQKLLIFPDNRTRRHMIGDKVLEDEVLQLFSMDTQNRKDIHRWMIKKGMAQRIIVTQSEVFQPFINLKKIIFIDPHKRYYNNQQDPRYSLAKVVKKMSEIYSAQVEEIQNTASLDSEQ